MGLKNNLANFLNLATKEELSYTKEQLAKRDEFIEVQKRLLDNSTNIRNITKLSGLAQEQTERVSGSGTNVRKKPIQLQNLYFTNQFIFRGVNIRADELVTRGYKIIGGDDNGNKECTELMERSGGLNFLRRISVNTDVYGDEWLELVWNKDSPPKLMYLDHIHPATFGFKTSPNNSSKILFDKSGRPVGYQQTFVDENGQESVKDVPKENIAHITFHQIADEFIGVSILQPVYDTIVRLMNMEYAAAEAAVRTANPIYVLTLPTKAPNVLYEWANIFGNISSKDQLLLPEGVVASTLQPGQQNFSAYASYFLDAVVAATGVPKPLLLGTGEGSNRAVSVVQTRYFQSLIETNQDSISRVVNDIFSYYGDISGFDPPKLVFNEITEDSDVTFKTAIDLFTNGIITLEEARHMIGIEEEGTGPLASIKKPTEKLLKTSDMNAWHNNPGQKSGSQAGEKTRTESTRIPNK
jgi:hypothetical protein